MRIAHVIRLCLFEGWNKQYQTNEQNERQTNKQSVGIVGDDPKPETIRSFMRARTCTSHELNNDQTGQSNTSKESKCNNINTCIVRR